MNDKFLQVLTKWNGGILRGGAAKLTKELGLGNSVVSLWCKNKAKPSEENLQKMLSVFTRDGIDISAQDLYKIFNRPFQLSGGLDYVSAYHELPVAGLAHAGTVLFVSKSAVPQRENKMKVIIKIADDSFVPTFQKDDKLVIDTNAAARTVGVCLARTKQEEYGLFKHDAGTFTRLAGTAAQKGLSFVGWVTQIIKDI